MLINNYNIIFGDAGYRSPYLSHAKRALYHLSYIPNDDAGSRAQVATATTWSTNHYTTSSMPPTGIEPVTFRSSV